MNETAKHQALAVDPSTDVVESLEKLDWTVLSFIQLTRLRNLLQQASCHVEKELLRRAGENNSGDTVRIPSPKI
jgi:hypothetical protein